MRVVISIPHGSSCIPEELESQFRRPFDRFRKHEDLGTDSLGDIDGFTVVKAGVSRFVVDLNRNRGDVGCDFGVITLKDTFGQPVLARPLTEEEVGRRLEEYYDPFHEELAPHLEKGVFLVDCHSMDSVGNIIGGDEGERPDICLSTNGGSLCREEIVRIFQDAFEREGLSVRRDYPYRASKARIANGARALGAEALQLEFNKGLYMNEETYEIDGKKVARLKEILEGCLKKISEM